MANTSTTVTKIKRMTATPAYLVHVYDTARATGETTLAMIALLRSAKLMWGDKALIGPIAEAFRQGRMAGSLGVNREEAKRILSLKALNPKAKLDDKHRTIAQQQAYRAAISAWSYCAQQAGMPHAKTGGTRNPKARKTVPAAIIVADNKSTAPVVLERVIVPTAPQIADVRQFAHGMASLMSRFQKKNARTVSFDYCDLFEAFIKGVAALDKSEAAVTKLKLPAQKAAEPVDAT